MRYPILLLFISIFHFSIAFEAMGLELEQQRGDWILSTHLVRGPQTLVEADVVNWKDDIIYIDKGLMTREGFVFVVKKLTINTQTNQISFQVIKPNNTVFRGME